jgi:hypothetical protein
MFERNRGRTLFPAALAGAALLACSEPSQPPVAPLGSPRLALIANPPLGNRTAELERFEVCKDYVGADAGPVTIQISESPSGQTGSVTLANGECRDIGVNGSATLQTITVTENPVPAGYTASWSRTVVTAGSAPVQSSGSGGSVSGPIGGSPLNGTLVIITNTEIVPPGGGQGCTPGYWKQSHHFDSWQGFAPTDKFETVFGRNAFPGDPTLVQIAANGGGGINALGRHTVAALLNAASSGVNYDLSVAQVIAAFQAAFDSGNLEAQKNIFSGFNEQGCPLN